MNRYFAVDDTTNCGNLQQGYYFVVAIDNILDVYHTMARIPDKDIERLKTEVSLQRLIESQGIQLKKHGKDYLGLCPFHDDHDPSLVISPDKNLWHCLGACQTGGSVIDWVMQREGVSFRHAVELLQNDVPSLVASSKSVAGAIGDTDNLIT